MKIQRKKSFLSRRKWVGMKGATKSLEFISRTIDQYLDSNPREFKADFKKGNNGIYYFNIFVPEKYFYKKKKNGL